MPLLASIYVWDPEKLIDQKEADLVELTKLIVNGAMASSDLLHLARSAGIDDANESTRDDSATPQRTDDPPNLPDPIYKVLNGRRIRIRLPGNPLSVVSRPVFVSKPMDPSPPVGAADPPEDSAPTRSMLEYDRFIERLNEFIRSSKEQILRPDPKLEYRSSSDFYQETRQTKSPICRLFALPEHTFPVPNVYEVTTIQDRTHLHQPSHWSPQGTFLGTGMELQSEVDHAFDDMPDYHFVPQSLSSSELPQQQLLGSPTTDMLTLQQILVRLEDVCKTTNLVPSAGLAHFMKDAINDVDGASDQDVKGGEKSAQTVKTSQGTTFTVPHSDSDEEEYFTGSEGDDSDTEATRVPLRASDRSDREVTEQHEHVPGDYPVADDSPT